MTTIVLNTTISEVENKIPDTSSLVTTTVLNTKIGEIENKVPITTPDLNKLTTENFAARLKEANLVSKIDFDNNLISFDKKKLLQIKQNNSEF